MRKEVCALTKVYHFSAAHRLYSKNYSDEENRRVFGKCSNPKGHGHDYHVEVKVAGDIDPETGMVINLDDLDEAVTNVVEELDHTRLDVEIPYFRELHPSGENIVKYFWIRLKPRITEANLIHLKLWETPNNYFEYFEDQEERSDYRK